jgi:RNA polymerase sigma-70 factor (ECF subfamily)
MTISLSARAAAPDPAIEAETTRLAIMAQQGNADAFCGLLALHERAARRVAMAALGNEADADEAVQDAALTAWQRLSRLADPAAFRPWLLRITWRKALDRRRSLRAWITRIGSVVNRSTAVADPLADVADPQRSVVDRLLTDERDHIVQQIIRGLPRRLRDPFLLAASGDHRYEDIAHMLAMPVGTVKWRVSEARRVLRDKLARVGVDR